MSYFKRPIVLMFMGLPGSGKSYFARGVADRLNAVRLNGDSMRLAIFGSLEETDRLHESDADRYKLNAYTFDAINYALEQIMMRGYDVVYDAHHNKRVDRKKVEHLAETYDVLPIVIRVKTPYEVALKRGQTREVKVDQRQFSEEKMREVMARHQKHTDEPAAAEYVIEIDGQAPFEEQFQEFLQQAERIV